MLDTQMSFFDEGEAPEDGHKENLGDPLIESEDEVFALARGILPSLKAEALGLVAKWADYKKAKGHISIHDPGSDEWADLPYEAAPSWAQREARKRSEIYRSTGDARAFDYTAAEMHAIWEEEGPPQKEEGIVEEYELPDD
jgi:hypothetical protein